MWHVIGYCDSNTYRVHLWPTFDRSPNLVTCNCKKFARLPSKSDAKKCLEKCLEKYIWRFLFSFAIHFPPSFFPPQLAPITLHFGSFSAAAAAADKTSVTAAFFKEIYANHTATPRASARALQRSIVPALRRSGYWNHFLFVVHFCLKCVLRILIPDHEG